MIAIALMAMTGTSYAEGEGGVEASVGADVVSSYIWRGGKLDGAAIQPSLSVDYKGLSLGAWGSASIVGSGYKEIDFTLSYAVGGLTAMVTDYWCADDRPHLRGRSDIRFRIPVNRVVHKLLRRNGHQSKRRRRLLFVL